ncbi:MAG: chloramphenicol acetyltransferase [Ancalomicrobiaceae bacterium]|nr:chloramphenicol acetyltransferase [Ancalomicrobiaceae bacterium]
MDNFADARSSGKKLGDLPFIHPTAHVRDVRFGRYTEVGERTRIAESGMDDYSYVVNDSDIIYTTIGKFCSIAAMTRINPGNHPMHRATQAHFTYRSSAYFDGEADDQAFFDWRRQHRVSLGHDIWVGHGAIILAGRTIGTGAVVAAGAVVSKDVAPYTIVAGTPARVVKRRFDEKTAERMLALAWWDWEHERLHAALPDFRALTAEEFLEKHEG